MDFKLSRGYTQYQELVIIDDHTTLKSGLLNDKEAKELAIKLIDVAADLIRKEDEQAYSVLVDIYNDLNK